MAQGPARPARLDLPVALDATVRRYDGGLVLLGGDPARLVRLRPGAAALLGRLGSARGADEAVAVLARTLVERGLAHPRPPARVASGITVVVPVRDRAPELARCLTALGRRVPVLVVDDGSTEPAAVREVCRRHGVRLQRRPMSGGPAAARNTGLAATDSPLVAFLDSDCVPLPGWLDALVGHFADPLVGAVAPRVRGRVGATSSMTALACYAAARGPLDLGDREAGVRPGSRVPYVPSAALVVRRAAVDDAGVFDPALRYGEDVDLVWRLHDAGWAVRYDPRTVIAHEDPGSWSAWLTRRHRYGASAGPLARRHGARLAHLAPPPWPVTAWLLLLDARPRLAAAAAAVPALRAHRLLRRSGLPWLACTRTVLRGTCQGLVATGEGLGGAGTAVTAPVLLLMLRHRATRRSAVAALLAPPLLEWMRRRPRLDPATWVVLRLVDDLAYASGVWRGCLSARTAAPLRPCTSRPR